MARMYNDKLKRLLVELNKDLKGVSFVYADIYQILTDLTENYVSYGAYIPHIIFWGHETAALFINISWN